MYQLFIGNELIYRPGIEDLCLVDVQVTLELNKAGTLEFTMPPTHPFYDKLLKLKTYIDLYDDNDFVWRFRVLNTDDDFYKQRTVSCEGELSFLFDSIQRPYEHKGSIPAFFKMLIDNHNAQVEIDKKFEIGLCSVADNNNYVNRSNGHMSKTLDAINDKLIKTHGGYIRSRTQSGHRYIDYISDYGHECSQVIRFGENILDLSNYIQGENVRTAIIPQGAELEKEGINGVKKRLDIASVNGGKDYVYSESAVKLFGWIWDTVQFDDVTVASNLKKKAEAYLDECTNLQMSLELTAVDLHLLDVDIEKIKLGDWVQVISDPHGLNRKFLVSKLSIDVENPEKNKITLGSILPTFTSDTSKSSKEISDRVNSIATVSSQYVETAVDNATKLITGGMGGFVVISQSDDGHPEGILILDKPDKDAAKNVIQLNKNGLGFSTTGINGPYRNAWTIDGNLVADFITSGVLRGVEIIGGSIKGETTIEVGTDLKVGNRIIIGDQKDNGLINYKSIDFSDNVHILGSRDETGYYQLALNALHNVTMTTGALGGVGSSYASVGVLESTANVSASYKIFMTAPSIEQSVTPTVTSDKRKKKDIHDIDTSWIDDLRVVGFSYKGDSQKQIGLIAQDCLGNDYADYFIDRNEKGYYSIRYGNILNALIKYCQELKQRIIKLEGEQYGEHN